MIEVRPFTGLGHANHGWLDARHHFSFAEYLDRDRMGWGKIRVWNDDTIAPGTGFPMHPHNDMEIVTYVRTGAITHEDSLGNKGRTEAGDVQVMSAGTGIVHSEVNAEDEPTTLFQIWIRPDRVGETPSWGQRRFPGAGKEGRWSIVASGDPDGDDALPINNRARVLAARLTAGQTVDYAPEPGRHQYLVATSGAITVNGHEVGPRDGVAIEGETAITVSAREDAELVMVDAG